MEYLKALCIFCLILNATLSMKITRDKNVSDDDHGTKQKTDDIFGQVEKSRHQEEIQKVAIHKPKGHANLENDTHRKKRCACKTHNGTMHSHEKKKCHGKKEQIIELVVTATNESYVQSHNHKHGKKGAQSQEITHNSGHLHNAGNKSSNGNVKESDNYHNAHAHEDANGKGEENQIDHNNATENEVGNENHGLGSEHTGVEHGAGQNGPRADKKKPQKGKPQTGQGKPVTKPGENKVDKVENMGIPQKLIDSVMNVPHQIFQQ